MKQYRIRALVKGHCFYEDPHCPASWMGSHVYDIEVPARFDVTCDVFAENASDAADLVEGFPYDSDSRNPYAITVDVVEVKDVEFVEDVPSQEEELVEVEYGEAERDTGRDFWDEVDEKYQFEKENR